MTFVTTRKDLSKGRLQVDLWLVAVLVCFILFAWASWGRLDEPLIDVGREVEISSRLLTGQLLYRDIATYYGPLAYYANALALLVFGQRLEVFYAVGIGLALVATLLFYRLAKRLTDGPWAAVSTVCMVIYCALGPGLFYFMLPYSYGAVYGIVLCLVAITALDCYLSNGRIIWLVGAAIACGLAGVAKQEYGVAALAAILVGANLYSRHNLRTRVGRTLLILMVGGGCAILPYALIAQQVTWGKMLSFLFPASSLSALKQHSPFNLSIVETLVCWLSTFKGFFAGSLVILISTIAAHRISKSQRVNIPQWLRSLFDLLASFAFAWVNLLLINKLYQLIFHPNTHSLTKNIFSLRTNRFSQPLEDLSWSIPVFILWFAVNRPQLPQYKLAPLMWTLLVFSLLLNARWLFCIGFYGLYAPPILLLFFTLLYHLTQRIKPTKGVVWRYLVVCLLLVSTMKLKDLGSFRYAISSSRGTFYTSEISIVNPINQTINFIKTSKAASVLVLPEANIVNFLTGTHSPSRELTFLPIALPTSKDEHEFVEHMQNNPPELIVFVPRDFDMWKYKSYAEFNPIVDHWITKQHKLIQSFPMGKDAIRIYAPN